MADEVALLVADIFEAAGALRRMGESIAAAEGQTQARWQLLSVVSDEPMSVPYAARRLGVTRQSVQRIANDLVTAGLVEYQENPDHRTSPLVALTKEGRDTLAAISARAQLAHEELTASGIATDDLTAARNLLKRLTAEVRHLEESR